MHIAYKLKLLISCLSTVFFNSNADDCREGGDDPLAFGLG